MKDHVKEKERLRKWRAANPDKLKAQQQRANKKKREAEYYIKNKDVIFDQYLNRTYGIGIDKYNSLLLEQSGVCDICKNECVSGKRLAVDHNHETGEVRGLLCCKCNRGLGNLDDDIDKLRSAVLYLERYQSKSCK